MSQIYKHRTYTDSEWEGVAPIPQDGELIIVKGEGGEPDRIKIGDGITIYKNLDYYDIAFSELRMAETNIYRESAVVKSGSTDAFVTGNKAIAFGATGINAQGHSSRASITDLLNYTASDLREEWEDIWQKIQSNTWTEEDGDVFSFAVGDYAYTEGLNTVAMAENRQAPHAEGKRTRAIGQAAHSEGTDTLAEGNNAHAEGQTTQAKGPATHAEGYQTIAQSTENGGCGAHAEGVFTQALKAGAHAEGSQTKADKAYAHAEGHLTQAMGEASHAEGRETVAQANWAHAEGRDTIAKGQASHAEGRGTIASGEGQHVGGKYNIEDSSSLFIIGNGTRDSARSNALKLESNGKMTIAGDLVFNGDKSVTELLNKLSAFNTMIKQGDSGGSSYEIGYQHVTNGQCAGAIGTQNTVNNHYATAIGMQCKTSGDYQTVLGRYNEDDDKALVIMGSGTKESTRRNSITIAKSNGQVNILTPLRASGTATFNGAATFNSSLTANSLKAKNTITIGSTTITENQLKELLELSEKLRSEEVYV